MSLWIERAARKVREETLLRRTEELLEVALAGTESCEYLIVLGRGGELFFTAGGDWALDRLLAEHGGEAAWRVRRDGNGIEIEGRTRGACARLRHRTHSFSPGPPRAGSARLLPAASG